jgi:hypothetical protein
MLGYRGKWEIVLLISFWCVVRFFAKAVATVARQNLKGEKKVGFG